VSGLSVQPMACGQYTNETQLYYRVIAESRLGHTAGAVTNVILTPNTGVNAVKLTWSVKAGADGYYVQRSDDANSWTQSVYLAGCDNTNYVDVGSNDWVGGSIELTSNVIEFVTDDAGVLTTNRLSMIKEH